MLLSNWRGPPTVCFTLFNIDCSDASLRTGENEKQFSFSPQFDFVIKNNTFFFRLVSIRNICYIKGRLRCLTDTVQVVALTSWQPLAKVCEHFLTPVTLGYKKKYLCLSSWCHIIECCQAVLVLYSSITFSMRTKIQPIRLPILSLSVG